MTTMEKKVASREVDSAVRETIVNDDPKMLESFSVGDVSHQGDLVIVCVESLPPSATPRSERQLAIGTTKGSRHVLERGELFDCFPLDVVAAIKAANGVEVDGAFVGPMFISPDEPTDSDLTHPEHGNQGFPAGAVCAVVYQRNLDAMERAVRARD